MLTVTHNKKFPVEKLDNKKVKQVKPKQNGSDKEKTGKGKQ